MSITGKWIEGKNVFSNQDDTEPTLTEEYVKKSAEYHPHIAWHFLGSVYWDECIKLFVNEIKIYGTVVNIITDETLKGCITKANEMYGDY